MRSTLRVVLGAAALVAAVSACEPIPIPPVPIAPATAEAPPPQPAEVTCAAIGCPRLPRNDCERLPAADWIRADGYEVDCAPTFPRPVDDRGVAQRGMTRHSDGMVFIWPSSNDAVTIAVAWHEQCHVAMHARGRTFATQEEAEDYCWGWSWCRDPQSGLGYPVRPTPAECAASYT